MQYLLDGQQTERLIFRQVSLEDFNAWLEFFKHPHTFEHWQTERLPPEQECSLWYQYQFNRYANNLGGMNAVIEKASGRLAGHCGLLVQNVNDKTELEIAYSFLPEFWNKGYATEAAVKCKHFAFDNLLATSLVSIISVTNIASQQVALKNGMHISDTTIYKGNKVNVFRVNKN